MAVSVIVHECTAVGGGESAAVCVSLATRLKENLLVFVLACSRFSDRPKGIEKLQECVLFAPSVHLW